MYVVVWQVSNRITKDELDRITASTDGFSGSDLTSLCQDAAMVAIRELRGGAAAVAAVTTVRPVSYEDFVLARKRIRPSVDAEALNTHLLFNKQFGMT